MALSFLNLQQKNFFFIFFSVCFLKKSWVAQVTTAWGYLNQYICFLFKVQDRTQSGYTGHLEVFKKYFGIS